MNLDSEFCWHASARRAAVAHLVPFTQEGCAWLKNGLAEETHSVNRNKYLVLTYGLVERALPVPVLPSHFLFAEYPGLPAIPPSDTLARHRMLLLYLRLLMNWGAWEITGPQHLHLRFRLASGWFLLGVQTGDTCSQLSLLSVLLLCMEGRVFLLFSAGKCQDPQSPHC